MVVVNLLGGYLFVRPMNAIWVSCEPICLRVILSAL